jgi:hypothetical protein
MRKTLKKKARINGLYKKLSVWLENNNISIIEINMTPFQGIEQGVPIFFGRRIISKEKSNTKIDAPSRMSVVSNVI